MTSMTPTTSQGLVSKFGPRRSRSDLSERTSPEDLPKKSLKELCELRGRCEKSIYEWTIEKANVKQNNYQILDKIEILQKQIEDLETELYSMRNHMPSIEKKISDEIVFMAKINKQIDIFNEAAKKYAEEQQKLRKQQ